MSLELPKPCTSRELASEKLNTSSCILFGVVSAFPAVLNLTTTPFLREPCKSRLERPPSWVMIQKGSIDTSRMAVFHGFKVRF
jgi:hypothetical protein